MSHIDDDELILFHYRDGLPSGRLAEIATALATTPALARRYHALERLLAAVDHDAPPEPDARFEQRLWQRVQRRLQDGDTSPPPVAVVPVTAARRHRRHPARRHYVLAIGAGLAAVLALALVLPPGLPAQLHQRPALPAGTVAPQVAGLAVTPSAAAAAPWQASADRILLAQLAEHLHRTRGVLQSVENEDIAALLPGDDAYLRALAQDNRLFAAAAERRGIRALAGFLRSLDPLLLELAQRTGPGNAARDADLRRFVREEDLLFRVDAAHARLLVRDRAPRA